MESMTSSNSSSASTSADWRRASSAKPGARVSGAQIDRQERKGKGASDHAPVVVDLAD